MKRTETIVIEVDNNYNDYVQWKIDAIETIKTIPYMVGLEIDHITINENRMFKIVYKPFKNKV